MASRSTTYATLQGQEATTLSRHPLPAASLLSRLLLGWVTPLMKLGNRKQLDEGDIWQLQSNHKIAVISARFTQDFYATQSIPLAFLRSFGWRFALAGIGFLIATASTLIGPVVLNHVVSALASDEYRVLDLVIWIVGLFATQLLQSFADTFANFDSQLLAIQFTAALKNRIYCKALKLDASGRKHKSIGDITNIFTTDCEMILTAAFYVHQLWIVPLLVVAVGIQLYQILGAASLAGFAVIGVVFFLNNLVTSSVFKRYFEFMEAKDGRLKAVSETFKAIPIIKFNAWEDKFLERIAIARKVEIQGVWSFMKFNALTLIFTWGLPVFVSVATFSVFAGVMGQELTPTIVFTSISLFQLVQFPLNNIASTISAVIQAKVALSRMSKFLTLPEIDNGNVLTIESPEADQYIAKNDIVAVENATFAWDRETPLLQNINLHVKVGDFVVIHGPVGSGKSSLCSALLGDMVKTRGQVYVGGSVAYCSQQPWIQHATVRDNILFGRPFDRKKYEKVLDACALTTDLQSLPAGDRTEIGERGVNLSGGQKARVALARACYSDASVYILDAPLSAVDAIVQNEIFQRSSRSVCWVCCATARSCW